TLVVSSATDHKELGRATADVGGTWQTIGLRFVPAEADVVVEIYADQSQYKGNQAGAGSVWVTLVEMARIADAGATQRIPDLGENIALGALYTMSRATYGLSRDDGDKVQLTDGVYTEGYFWTQKTTVGWTRSGPKFVQIDLGRDLPIRGISFNSAAGVAGVTLPKRIVIMVSSDGEQWYDVGDLVALHEQHDPLPPYGQYHVVRLWTDQLRTHGRWVGLGIEPGGPYTFCDEIEVYRGDDAWLAEAREGDALPPPERYMQQVITTGLVREQFRRDLEAVRADIAEVEGGARGLMQKAEDLAAAIERMRPFQMDGFRAVLPMTELERDIFRLQAEVWRAQDKPELRVWHQHRWDPLAPSAEPADDSAPELSVHMMNNEYRADVLNITNAGRQDLRVQVRVTGLPGGDNPDWIALHQVEHVGTRHFTSVAAALPEAEREGDHWLVTVPSGMTRQVWLAFNRPDLPAGAHSGAVELRAAGRTITVPLRLRIYPLRFPDETTLLVGGWSYTNTNAYGVTDENRIALIQQLSEHFVNAPWATSRAMPAGKYDAEGNMTEEPSIDNFDAWVADWPDAKMYMVFLGLNPGSTFAGAERGTERFNIALGNWARFWAEHLEDLGIDPSRLAVLTIDEPHSQEQYDAIMDWARAIKAAGTGIRIFEDPTAREPEGLEAMYRLCDILCPNRPRIMTLPPWYREQVQQAKARGTQMWLYSCSGPARSFDPFSYYLAQEWDAFRLGANGSAFWCFSDTGGVSCWNEYPVQGAGPYCPSYIDDTSVTTAKYLEAIREGVEDYEYLTMLRARVAELENKGVPAAELAKARELLSSGPDRVLAGEDGPNFRWDEQKDRAAQDRVRVEVLKALTELAKL
ncbi:MAG: hypothetical protein J7M38_01275, partial [Armatimonadetes bacterium]|nr:hypothetical protein [Armatimonadota bacterium]